jgi:hypothetical protein
MTISRRQFFSLVGGIWAVTSCGRESVPMNSMSRLNISLPKGSVFFQDETSGAFIWASEEPVPPKRCKELLIELLEQAPTSNLWPFFCLETPDEGGHLRDIPSIWPPGKQYLRPVTFTKGATEIEDIFDDPRDEWYLCIVDTTRPAEMLTLIDYPPTRSGWVAALHQLVPLGFCPVASYNSVAIFLLPDDWNKAISDSEMTELLMSIYSSEDDDYNPLRDPSIRSFYINFYE